MSGAGERRWLTDQEQAAWRGLLLMHAHLTTTLSRQLADRGLSLQDYGVLANLAESPCGSLRPYELAELLGLEKTRLSHLLHRLEQRGLLERRRCPSDQRGWLVGISAAGREALAEAAPGHVAAVREAFVDRLSPAQLRSLADMAAAVLADPEPG